jgi:spore coat protein U-like protein
MTPKILPTLAAALATSLACPAARATTSCSFTSVVGVAFGSYDVFSLSPLDTAGSLTFVCSGVGPSDTVVIELSAGGAASFSPRSMASMGASLSYNLYLNAARTAIWGDGTGGTSRYGPVTPVSGVGVTVPVYGRVPAGQNVPIGAYADTITVTILF